MQNALFRRVRLSSPGQTWRHLTEKRILVQTPHGKAHSVLIDSRKGALCDPQIAQTAPFRHAAAPGRCRTTPRQAAGHYGKRLNWANALEQPPRQPAGHYGKRPNWANALEQPPASLRGGLRQVAETGTTTSVTAPVRRAPLHARSNRAGSFKLPLCESRLRRGKCLFP